MRAAMSLGMRPDVDDSSSADAGRRRLDPRPQLLLEVEPLRAVLLHDVDAVDRRLEVGRHGDPVAEVAQHRRQRGDGRVELLLQVGPRVLHPDVHVVRREQRRPRQPDRAGAEDGRRARHADGASVVAISR